MPANEWDYELEGGESNPFAGFVTDLYFTDSEYGPKAQIKVRRSHPELTPNANAEVTWNYNVAVYEDKGWSVSPDGLSIVHAEGRKLNASTPFGKLFASLREYAPAPIPGFDPQDAKSWKGLESQGDFLWNWSEKYKNKKDDRGKWVPDTDKKPERTLLIVGYAGEGAATNGHVDTVDIASLNLGDDEAAIKTAAAGAAPGKDGLSVALVSYAMKNPALMGVLTSNPEGLREALVGF